MYVGYNCILVTRDGAQTWKAFSPDLTTPKGQPMAAVRRRACASGDTDARSGPHESASICNANTHAGVSGRSGYPASGSISDFSISTVKRGVVWSGSSTGQIYNTMDGGKTWNNVTNFADLPANANFVTVEAGHSDVNTAYVLANLGFGRGAAPQARSSTTSIARTTAARHGRASSMACRPMNVRAVRSTSFERILNRRVCSLPAPRRPSTCRSTMAITGSRCD